MLQSTQERHPKTQRARRSKAPRKRLSESEGEGACVVCAHQIDIYSVGHCDHYICFKCSTKIRLLCNETVCPVCRKELRKVIFTKKKDTFEKLNQLKLIKDKDYDVGIYFADVAIIKNYKKMLEHKCPKCPDRPPDRTFEDTKVHLRKEHTLFYCEICLEHNNTFTNECKVYTRKDLATHRRSGDPDDQSHRGHPLCEYCDVRYLDDDKLFHHLRTTHYYCHICDIGENYEFYANYPDLRLHFKKGHFLCEVDGCAEEEFTSVFATELDFKAHCATAHKDTKSKVQQRMDRQIDLGFQYSRRDPPQSRGRGQNTELPRSRKNKREVNKNYVDAFERDTDLDKAIALSKEEATKVKETKTAENKDMNQAATSLGKTGGKEGLMCVEPSDFPTLSTVATSTPLEDPKAINVAKKSADSAVEASTSIMSGWNKNLNISNPILREEHFPSLSSEPGSSKAAIPPWGKQTYAKKNSSTAAKTGTQAKVQTTINSKPVRSQPVTSKIKKRLIKKEDDFPELNPNNVILVGRGAGKHLEAYESFSTEQTSNVKIIKNPAEEGANTKTKVNETNFANLLNDFPSLSLNAPASRVLAPPPGFGNFQSKQKQPLKSSNATSNTVFTNGDNEDFPGLPMSNVRVPPGFVEISGQNTKGKKLNGKKSSKDSLQSVKNAFAVNPADYPSLPVNAKKVPGFSLAKHKTAGTTLSVNPVQIPADNNTENKNISTTSTTQKIAHRQKGFASSDLNRDFPGLHTPAQPAYDTRPFVAGEPTTETEELPVGTNLNLANVFDFPSL